MLHRCNMSMWRSTHTLQQLTGQVKVRPADGCMPLLPMYDPAGWRATAPQPACDCCNYLFACYDANTLLPHTLACKISNGDLYTDLYMA